MLRAANSIIEVGIDILYSYVRNYMYAYTYLCMHVYKVDMYVCMYTMYISFNIYVIIQCTLNVKHNYMLTRFRLALINLTNKGGL